MRLVPTERPGWAVGGPLFTLLERGHSSVFTVISHWLTWEPNVSSGPSTGPVIAGASLLLTLSVQSSGGAWDQPESSAFWEGSSYKPPLPQL